MHRAWSFAAAVYAAFRRHRDAQVASAIAYSVLFAIVPLTGLLLAAFGFLMRDPQQQANAVDHVLAVLPLQANSFVTDSIRGIARESVALSALGLVGIVWSASGLFGAIRDALNGAWEVRSPHNFLVGKLFDVAVMLGLGVLLAASVAGTVASHLFLQSVSLRAPYTISFQTPAPMPTLLGVLLPAIFSFTCFMLLYRFVPNVKHCARDVWLGAAVATLLFESCKHGFTLYVTRLSPNRTSFGVLGDVMLFMLWTWVSAIVLLIGAEVAAEFNRIWCGRAIEAKHPAFEEGPEPAPPRS